MTDGVNRRSFLRRGSAGAAAAVGVGGGSVTMSQQGKAFAPAAVPLGKYVVSGGLLIGTDQVAGRLADWLGDDETEEFNNDLNLRMQAARRAPAIRNQYESLAVELQTLRDRAFEEGIQVLAAEAEGTDPADFPDATDEAEEHIREVITQTQERYLNNHILVIEWLYNLDKELENSTIERNAQEEEENPESVRFIDDDGDFSGTSNFPTDDDGNELHDRVDVTLADGSEVTLPNIGDPDGGSVGFRDDGAADEGELHATNKAGFAMEPLDAGSYDGVEEEDIVDGHDEEHIWIADPFKLYNDEGDPSYSDLRPFGSGIDQITLNEDWVDEIVSDVSAWGDANYDKLKDEEYDFAELTTDRGIRNTIKDDPENVYDLAMALDQAGLDRIMPAMQISLAPAVDDDPDETLEDIPAGELENDVILGWLGDPEPRGNLVDDLEVGAIIDPSDYDGSVYAATIMEFEEESDDGSTEVVKSGEILQIQDKFEIIEIDGDELNVIGRDPVDSEVDPNELLDKLADLREELDEMEQKSPGWEPGGFFGGMLSGGAGIGGLAVLVAAVVAVVSMVNSAWHGEDTIRGADENRAED